MARTDMTQHFTITHYAPGTPREVWDAWTTPAAIAQWWRLPGTTTPAHELEYDVRAGGSYIYSSLDDQTGHRSVSAGVFHEVVPPHRLVFSWGAPGLHNTRLPIVSVEIDQTSDGSYVALTLTGFSGEPGDGGFYDVWDEALLRLKQYVAEQKN